MTPELEQNLKRSEALKLVAYIDTTGNYTVGWGHKLAPGHNWRGYVITQDYAAGLLVIDVNEASYLAAALPEWAMLDTQARKDALIELLFEMGENRWRQFVNTRAALLRSDWQAVSNGLLASLWAKQVGPARAGRVASQMATGAYTEVIASTAANTAK